jgi:hypothetical protein
MFDNDTQLLVAIFQEVFHPEKPHKRFYRLVPAGYVKTYKSQIEIAGQLFEYLDLAKSDPESPLGWRPTHLLLEVIAKRAARQSKPLDRFVHVADDLTTTLLCDAVFGDLTDPSVDTGLGFCVLRALRLLRKDKDGFDLPSLELRQLFAEAFFARRLRQERAQRQVGIASFD